VLNDSPALLNAEIHRVSNLLVGKVGQKSRYLSLATWH